MPFVISRFEPADYDAWHATHLEPVRRFRQELGVLSDVLLHDHETPATVMVLLEVESLERYQAFLASEAFTELVSQAGGLVGEMSIWFADKIEEVDLSS